VLRDSKEVIPHDLKDCFDGQHKQIPTCKSSRNMVFGQISSINIDQSQMIARHQSGWSCWRSENGNFFFLRM